MFFLQETKCNASSLSPWFSLKGFTTSAGSDSIGSAEGLFLCWKPHVVVVVLVSTANVIFCKAKASLNHEYYIAFVYGSPYLEDKLGVWEELQALMLDRRHDPIVCVTHL